MFRLNNYLKQINVYSLNLNFLKTNLNNLNKQKRLSSSASLENNNNKKSLTLKQQQEQQQKQQQQQQQQQKQQEISPIRKLLRVKDYVDFLIFVFLSTGIYIGYKKSKSKIENEKKFNIEWIQNIPNLKHKIFTCNNFYLPEFLAKNLEKFKSFKLRKDDVWIVSFPKSGTTWVQELVYLIVNNCDFDKAKKDSIENRSPFLDYPSPGLKYIDNMSDQRIIKTHLPICFLPDNIQNESKIIYIVRNPKDVAVSYYHFVKLSTQAEYSANFDSFSKLFNQGKVPYGPWWSHVDDYVQTKNVHVIFYEDLHEKPFQVIKSLSQYLGKELSDEQINSIINWCSFDNMKQNPQVNYEWYKTLGLYKKEGNFFRKGKIGDWLNHYSKEDSIELDQILKNNFKSNLNFNYGISQSDLNKIYSFQK